MFWVKTFSKLGFVSFIYIIMHVSFSDVERTYIILLSIDTTRAFQVTKYTNNSHFFFSTSLPKEHRKLENGDLEHVILLVINKTYHGIHIDDSARRTSDSD